MVNKPFCRGGVGVEVLEVFWEELWLHFFWPTFWLHCILCFTYRGGFPPRIGTVQMQCSQKVGQKKWSHNSSQKTSRASTPTPPLQKGLLIKCKAHLCRAAVTWPSPGLCPSPDHPGAWPVIFWRQKREYAYKGKTIGNTLFKIANDCQDSTEKKLKFTD